jgi:hypothetical protein
MRSKRKSRKTETAVIGEMVEAAHHATTDEAPSAADIQAVLTEAQRDVPAGEIDHHSQAASLTPPLDKAAPVAEATRTEPAEDLEAALATIAGEGLPPVVEDAVPEAQAEPEILTDTEEARTSFAEVMALVTDEQVDRMVWATANALDERVSFELAIAPDNDNIRRTLKKARAEIVTKAAARVMVAANVDVGFINRTIHEGARYNVYAIGKFADIVKAQFAAGR